MIVPVPGIDESGQEEDRVVETRQIRLLEIAAEVTGHEV